MANSSSHSAPADRSRPRSRRRPAVLTAAAVALLSAAAAGCNGSGDGSAAGPTADGNDTSQSAPATTPGTATPTDGSSAGQATTTPEPPADTTGPSASSGSSGSPGSSGGTQQQAAARCTVTDLKMTLGRGDPGAGNVYFPLDFTNTTGHSCTLNGFPGVSLLRGDGSVIGKPATRQSVQAAAVRIAPGQTVEADLHTLNQGVRDGGCWRTPTLIMVYPPGSTQSMTLATKNPVVCGDTFDVGPVH